LTTLRQPSTFCAVHRLDEALIRDWVPPDVKTRVVYHYTSAAGLIGILTSGELRGTSASFLNDTSEIEHGLSICKAVLEEERAARTSAEEQTLLERTLGLLGDEVLLHEVYLTSFSARRDVLSQWRGYGSSEGRFCIGFQLSQFSERDVLYLPRPVAYQLDEQRERVKRAVRVACEMLRDDPDPGNAWRYAASLSFHLHRLMCWFKHAGFAEEQEWRSMMTLISEYDLQHISFEPFRGAPRPYVAMLAGSRTSSRLPGVEVCIGPTERAPATYRATQLLLAKTGTGMRR
jgi:hypothetical protein